MFIYFLSEDFAKILSDLLLRSIYVALLYAEKSQFNEYNSIIYICNEM